MLPWSIPWLAGASEPRNLQYMRRLDVFGTEDMADRVIQLLAKCERRGGVGWLLLGCLRCFPAGAFRLCQLRQRHPWPHGGTGAKPLQRRGAARGRGRARGAMHAGCARGLVHGA